MDTVLYVVQQKIEKIVENAEPVNCNQKHAKLARNHKLFLLMCISKKIIMVVN